MHPPVKLTQCLARTQAQIEALRQHVFKVEAELSRERELEQEREARFSKVVLKPEKLRKVKAIKVPKPPREKKPRRPRGIPGTVGKYVRTPESIAKYNASKRKTLEAKWADPNQPRYQRKPWGVGRGSYSRTPEVKAKQQATFRATIERRRQQKLEGQDQLTL